MTWTPASAGVTGVWV